MHTIRRRLEVCIGPCDAERPEVQEFHVRPVVLRLTRCGWLVCEFVCDVLVVHGELVPGGLEVRTDGRVVTDEAAHQLNAFAPGFIPE